MTYAGRLDPMAEGKLLLLVGDECKKQRKYHGLDKTYRFEVLFGFSTDTGDILGMPEACQTEMPTEAMIQQITKTLRGMIRLPYPRFSSKTVKGKPLFLWTLEERLHEIEIPTAETRIHSLRFLGVRRVSYETLREDILRRIKLPTAVTEESKKLGEDFRRKDIAPAWNALLNVHGHAVIASFEATVSAGTYIRSLAPYIGECLGTSALAYSIDRTRIGRYIPLPLIGGIWIKVY